MTQKKSDESNRDIANPDYFSFTSLIDLCSEKLGGEVLSATDDFFAEKENLLKPGRGVFIADKYTDRGKWMDGWESRRKRTPGHDSCTIKLAVPGRVHGFDIDTNHFLGNHPPFASVEACRSGDSLDDVSWSEILTKKPLEAGSQNLFECNNTESWTHLRLHIYPDGGVARFRAYGQATPDWSTLGDKANIDMAAALNGAQILDCSDMFFGKKDNLIMPGRSVNMGDGWETRRKRDPGNDWIVAKLAAPIVATRIELDTDHFKGNYPDSFSIDGCFDSTPDHDFKSNNRKNISWFPIIKQTKLAADDRRIFESAIVSKEPVTHVRLNIFPDGGIARLRIFGDKQ